MSAAPLLPPPLAAQSLPPYAALNPVAQMRTGLATLPWFHPRRRWHVSVTADYGSLIEYHQDRYVLDAEILATRVQVARQVGRRGFLLAGTSFGGSYHGFLDGFLDWYHDFTGFEVAPRKLRPTNEFAYEIQVEDDSVVAYRREGAYLGDVLVGGGLRNEGSQTAFWLTIPTSKTPRGYRKGVISANAVTMYHHDFGGGKRDRFTYEGTFGIGYTKRNAELESWQRTTFFLIAQGLRARIVGPWHGYANLVYTSPYYRDTGIPELDRKDLTIDFGALFRFKRGPTWLLGLTEDLSPSGPAIDIAFRLGAYW
ncbi:MAG: DUF3187 family protein [Gemmatimonadales bacterium]